MAKKSRSKAPKSEKVRLELNFEKEIYEKIKSLADRAELSMNQLLQGITTWAIKNGHAGEPCLKEDGDLGEKEINTVERQGCVWFGPAYGSEPRIVFTLDFTEWGALREY